MKAIVRSVLKGLPRNKSFFNLLKAVGVPNKASHYLNFEGEYGVRINDKVIKLYSTGSVTDNRLFWRGLDGSETMTLKLWQYFSKKSNVILDVGANIGVFALVSWSVNPKASVHGFEPLPDAFGIYKKNAGLNSQDIRCHEVAISDFDGTTKIAYDPANNVTASLGSNSNRSHAVDVKVRSLDSMSAEIGIQNTDLVKIDVETYEPYVLRGMQNMLRANKPVLFIEVLNDEVGLENQSLLTGMGYTFHYIDEHRGLIPSAQMKRLSKSRNYLVCTDAQLQDLKKHLPECFAKA